jgi:hypothetical protein
MVAMVWLRKTVKARSGGEKGDVKLKIAVVAKKKAVSVDETVTDAGVNVKSWIG